MEHSDNSKKYNLHAGCPLRVDFTEPLTEEQRGWLLRTPLTLRRISFCPEDVASSTLLHRWVYAFAVPSTSCSLPSRPCACQPIYLCVGTA